METLTGTSLLVRLLYDDVSFVCFRCFLTGSQFTDVQVSFMTHVELKLVKAALSGLQYSGILESTRTGWVYNHERALSRCRKRLEAIQSRAHEMNRLQDDFMCINCEYTCSASEISSASIECPQCNTELVHNDEQNDLVEEVECLLRSMNR